MEKKKQTEEDKIFQDALKATMSAVQQQGLLNGAKGILGAILDMCKDGKSVGDIQEFCEKSLNMGSMK